MRTVSNMTSESLGQPAGQHDAIGSASALQDLARAEVLAHTRYPKLGSWYPPTVGVIVATWIAFFAAPSPVDLIGLGATLLTFSALTTLYVRRRGVIPNVSQAPTELKRVMTAFFVAYGVFIVGSFLLWQLTTWWVTALVAGTVATIGVAFYERWYCAAARAAEERVGVSDVPDLPTVQ